MTPKLRWGPDAGMTASEVSIRIHKQISEDQEKEEQPALVTLQEKNYRQRGLTRSQ